MDLEPPPSSRPKKTQSTCTGGPGEQEGGGSWSQSRAPGHRKESQRGRLPGGGQARPKAPSSGSELPVEPSQPGRGTDCSGGPLRSHKVASVPAFPVRGREVQIALAPPPELCSTRLGKGHCVPGLGSEERLMDPNLGAPRGRSLKFPCRLGRRSTVPAPPAEEGMICNKCVPSGGRKGALAGGRIARDPRRSKTSLASCNRRGTREIALAVRQVAPGFMGAGEEVQSQSSKGTTLMSISPPHPTPVVSERAKDPGPKALGSLASPPHTRFSGFVS